MILEYKITPNPKAAQYLKTSKPKESSSLFFKRKKTQNDSIPLFSWNQKYPCNI